MKLDVYFDGSFAPRQRVAAWGFVVKNEEGEVIGQGSGRACRGRAATSNVAEYEGLYQAMLWVSSHHSKASATFIGDSSLVIDQMNGEAKAKSGRYIPYYVKTVAFAEPFITAKLWKFRWLQRAFNSEADELAQYHCY